MMYAHIGHLHMKKHSYHEPTFNFQHFKFVGKMNEKYKFPTELKKGKMDGEGERDSGCGE